MKNVLFISLIVVGGAGWILFANEHRISARYAQREQARTDISESGKNASVAIFDRVDGATIHFRTAVQSETAQGTFTNYVEQTGTLAEGGRIFRTNKAGLRVDTLQGLASGTPISVDILRDPAHPNAWLIHTIYVTE